MPLNVGTECMQITRLKGVFLVTQGVLHVENQEKTNACPATLEHTFLKSLDTVLAGVSNAGTQPTLGGSPAAESAARKMGWFDALFADLATC